MANQQDKQTQPTEGRTDEDRAADAAARRDVIDDRTPENPPGTAEQNATAGPSGVEPTAESTEGNGGH